MLCISIRQPHAQAIMCSLKVEEYRTWKTLHRGALLIHASRTLAPAEAFEEYPNFTADRLPRGVILGAVDVEDCVEDVYGGFAWILARPRWLPKPLAWKGAAALFKVELPAELAEMLASGK